MWTEVIIVIAATFQVYGEECRDTEPGLDNCKSWKGQGHCLNSSPYYQYMQQNCKGTCNFCVPACSNKASYDSRCEGWKQGKLCEWGNQHYTFMAMNCKATCGFCKQKDTKKAECGLVGGRAGRVIGGVDAAPNYWKWQVALTENNVFFCGGSLIAPQWVLTAAHCTAYKRRMLPYIKVVLGEHNRGKREGSEVEIGVEKIINHPYYRYSTLQNDIALVKLKRPAPLNDKIGLVCLPKAGEQVAVGKKCYISGWGKMKHRGASASVLQQATMPIVAHSTCVRQNSPGPRITRKMVCAGYGPSSVISGCHGDSGGPLVCENDSYRYVLEGVVSWGSPRCNSKDKYTVFGRISEYIDWINQNMK